MLDTKVKKNETLTDKMKENLTSNITTVAYLTSSLISNSQTKKLSTKPLTTQ